MLVMIIVAVIFTAISHVAYSLLALIPFLAFLQGNAAVQAIFVCLVTIILMRGTVEEGKTTDGKEQLRNGATFYSNGHQLLSTHKEGANRTVRTYAAPDGQIVTTITDRTSTSGNGGTVFFATVLVLGAYLALVLDLL